MKENITYEISRCSVGAMDGLGGQKAADYPGQSNRPGDVKVKD